MATIKIADDIHPVRSNTSGVSSGVAGGIYVKRNVSRASIDRRSASRVSVDRRSEKSVDREEAEGGEPNLRQAGDFKERQVHLCLQPCL
jgi:KUP system potassium uptake protein